MKALMLSAMRILYTLVPIVLMVLVAVIYSYSLTLHDSAPFRIVAGVISMLAVLTIYTVAVRRNRGKNSERQGIK